MAASAELVQNLRKCAPGVCFSPAAAVTWDVMASSSDSEDGQLHGCGPQEMLEGAMEQDAGVHALEAERLGITGPCLSC